MNTFEWLQKQQVKSTIIWKEEAKKAQDARELKECTFAPQISKKQVKVDGDDVPVNERLYKMRKNANEKTDKAKEEYEFEKAKEECTFAPNLTRKPVKKQAASAMTAA